MFCLCCFRHKSAALEGMVSYFTSEIKVVGLILTVESLLRLDLILA